MALIKNYNIGGVDIPNAYFVITGLNAQKRLLDPVVTEVSPAVPAVPFTPPVLDENGYIVTPGIQGQPGIPAVTETTYVPSDKWDATITITVFKDKVTRNAGGQPITHILPTNLVSTTFEYDPTGSLPVIQGYQYLMSQPYFEGATVDSAS